MKSATRQLSTNPRSRTPYRGGLRTLFPFSFRADRDATGGSALSKWIAALALLAPLARAAEIEPLAPAAQAKPGTWYQAESKGGLHDAWTSGWSNGVKRYGKLWKEWKGP